MSLPFPLMVRNRDEITDFVVDSLNVRSCSTLGLSTGTRDERLKNDVTKTQHRLFFGGKTRVSAESIDFFFSSVLTPAGTIAHDD